ncbi:hypothetical protein EG68_04028 [Paragonimus skrjabini miyazakii]|uniref:Uncharacterized protein n=1 Tax=Paragonimus skrjabini miyazakii TaxID=59628 RepID=A0A8S9Z0C8_9TREM|nr:hypothetical protein EG68_04028 [Paragonimus skrjabini miyazakii]
MQAREIIFTVVLAGALGLTIAQPEQRATAEKSLIRDLLNRYKQYGVIGRPVNDSRVLMRVQYGLQLIQILGLDENKQVLRTNCWTVYRWNDRLLQWNSSQYEGIQVLRIFPHQIWTPDIKLYNFADERLKESREAGLLVYSDGSILWLQQALFKSTCQVEITYFPFDSQVCMLEFGSFTYEKELMELEWWTPDDSNTPMPYIDFSDYVPANDWLTDGEAERHVRHEERTKQIRSVKRYRIRQTKVGKTKQEKRYPVLRFLIRLYRNPSFHTFILIIPCLLLSLLTLVVFWLPPDSSAKMMLGINIFVAFFVLLLLLAESMPSSVKNFPLIGIFFCLNMAMVTLSTFLATMVVNLFYRGADGRPPPLWVRRYVIDRLGSILHLRQTIPLAERNCTFDLDSAMNTNTRTKWNGLEHSGTIETGNMIRHFNPDEQNLTYRNKLVRPMSESLSDKSDLNHIAQSQLENHTAELKHELRALDLRRSKVDRNELAAMEWRTLALIVDRVFFVTYLVIMSITLFAVVWTTEVQDMTQILVNRNGLTLSD